MNLTQILFDLWDGVHHTQDDDVIFGVVQRVNGGYRVLPLDYLRVEDRSKARVNRVLTEVADKAIPVVENHENKVVSFTVHYCRRRTYVLGLKVGDEPVLEHVIRYENGELEIRDVQY